MTDPLARLRAVFVERCRADQERLSAASPDDETFASTVHRLAGSAGSFGFPELSAAAAVVDQSLRNGEPPSPPGIAALMRELEEVVATVD